MPRSCGDPGGQGMRQGPGRMSYGGKEPGPLATSGTDPGIVESQPCGPLPATSWEGFPLCHHCQGDHGMTAWKRSSYSYVTAL